jgi:hypothetical protein
MPTNSHYKARLKIGVILLSLSLLIFMVKKTLLLAGTMHDNPWCTFAISLLTVVGSILLLPFEWIPIFFFDNEDYKPNVKLEDLIAKIRFRAVLFNNLSILIFVCSIGVIIVGFYLLSVTHPGAVNQSFFTNDLLIKLGLVTLLIFLVGILFRAFKYLLRVAAFYNGRADGLEISRLIKDENLKDMMTTMSPDSFDISDLPESSMIQSLGGLVKGK